MSQNTSHAVMAQRHEAHDSLDDFPTQPWATRALVEYVLFPNLDVVNPLGYVKGLSAWEPACNRGHMAIPLKEYFGIVRCSDIRDYSMDCAWAGQDNVCDFLFPGSESACIAAQGVNWIITNPPFRLAEQFIKRSFEFKNWRGTAMLVRTSFLEGVGRYNNIFSKIPPSFVAQFVERVPMVKGKLTAKGSTATSYAWLVWMEGEEPTRVIWIPPCRRRLERPGDYAEAA